MGAPCIVALVFVHVFVVMVTRSTEALTTDIRLVNGSRSSQGRVEVSHDGYWGTVCDDSFDGHAAAVVCRQLGFTGNLFLPREKAYFGSGRDRIWLDGINCTGTETSLFSCRKNNWGVTDCSHKEDVGVDCNPGLLPTVPIRLVDGANDREGRIEVQRYGSWGTICDDGFDANAASVVCRQLHFDNVVAVPVIDSVFGNVTNKPMLLDDIHCEGRELGIGQCGHRPWGSNNCHNNEEAGVMCIPSYDGKLHVEVSIAGSSDPLQGRLEVKINNHSFALCNDGNFGHREAGIVCRTLGYYSGGGVIDAGSYGAVTDGISFTNIYCNGYETSFSRCLRTPYQIAKCSKNVYVGIQCVQNPVPIIQVRLVSNDSRTDRGRVQIEYYGTWGTVCDNRWSASDAAVVCRMLNLPFDEAVALSHAAYGQGYGKIFMSDVDCNGTESTLTDCRYRGWDIQDCTHGQDAAVICQSATMNDTRLVNGTVPSQGRVEVLHNGQWGTVCDDRFDAQAAAVVCRQLGYTGNQFVARKNAFFGSGKGLIWLDEVRCNGTETSLYTCRQNTWGVNDCHHRDDVGVDCNPDQTANNIRLVNGTAPSQGRLEVFHDGKWGTICDDHFDVHAAGVVCRQLGYTGNLSIAREEAYFGSGTGQIWLDDVTCNGTETSMFACQMQAWGVNNCDHSEDVGVDCNPALLANVPVRLMDGTSNKEGRVEVLYNGVWGTVCENNWDEKAAAVICRQLGFHNALSVPVVNSYFGSINGKPILLDGVTCKGDEPWIGACAHTQLGVSTCNQTEEAGVMCLPNSVGPPTLQISLEGGKDTFEGRVELKVFNHWGTICDDSFDDREATVICRMLGHHRGGHVLSDGTYGAGSGPIWLDDLDCHGNETDLTQCVHNVFGANDCSHTEDVAINCTRDETTDSIRLVNGTVPSQGRVEVLHNGQWGSVCDDNFDAKAAAVVCRQLGFSGNLFIVREEAYFGSAIGQIWLDDVTCNGTETSLFSCREEDWGTNDCDHSEDVGVDCNPALVANVPVRLVDGTNNKEGRVEVLYNGVWGTVCENNWDDKAAAVLCGQLGFHNVLAVPVVNSYFGSINGKPILLDGVTCKGDEPWIGACAHKPLGVSTCNQTEEAGVMCLPNSVGPPTLQIRLKGGQDEFEGRVEFNVYNRWGTICDDSFDDSAATVVCRMLGHHSGGHVLSFGTYGAGSGPIWLDELECNGNETDLTHCVHNAFGVNDCSHTEDVAINCTKDPVTVPPTRPQSIQCMTCGGNDCEKYYGPGTCHSPNSYCISKLSNRPDGSRSVERRCGSFDECNRDWLNDSANSNRCVGYQMHVQSFSALNCTYCCTKDLCNDNIVPSSDSLFHV